MEKDKKPDPKCIFVTQEKEKGYCVAGRCAGRDYLLFHAGPSGWVSDVGVADKYGILSEAFAIIDKIKNATTEPDNKQVILDTIGVYTIKEMIERVDTKDEAVIQHLCTEAESKISVAEHVALRKQFEREYLARE